MPKNREWITGKTRYAYNLQCDPNIINQLIQSFLQVNNFKPKTMNGQNYYEFYSSMIGFRGFQYFITNQVLEVLVWVNRANKSYSLDDKIMNINAPAMSYRNLLLKLFQEIEKYNVGNVMNNNQNINNSHNMETQSQINYQQSIQSQLVYQQSVPAQNQFVQSFKDETIKKQEKVCEIGFWLSVFGLICSFFGIAYGVIIYILNFYFASQGLKTRKKGKAIATILISIISIIIIVISLLSYE